MADDSLAVVIEGRREDWPGGPRFLMPCPPSREPNRRTYWFGAELDPDGSQLWFRVTSEAIHRMREKTPLGPRGVLRRRPHHVDDAGASAGTRAQPLPGPRPRRGRVPVDRTIR